MDGAEASYLYLTVGTVEMFFAIICTKHYQVPTSRMVATVSAEGLGVSLSGAAVGADLGGSSKYSSEALED
jgi:hypothetical protein